MIDWLPPLEILDQHERNWNRFLDAIYKIFRQDFVDDSPVFRGIRIGLKKHPVSQGKEATFWHIISEGDSEENRKPDLRRCERIRWPRVIIEHAGHMDLKVWQNQRKGEDRILLFLEKENYLVVLAKRKTYILLWTAYLITEEHNRRKLIKEYEACHKKAGATSCN
jgi:hypothetical protein